MTRKKARIQTKNAVNIKKAKPAFLSSEKFHLFVLLIILIIGAYLRFSYVFRAERMPIASDAADYVKMAKGIVNRGTMSYGYGNKPSAYVMPGFPLFLAGIFRAFGQGESSLQIVRFAFALMSLSWIAFIYLIVLNLSDNKWLGVLAAVIAGFYPPFIWCSERILTEVLYTFSVMVCLWLMARQLKKPSWQRAVCSGAALGASLLIRPIMLWFIPIFLFFDFFQNRRFSREFLVRSAVFVAAILVCLTPWIIRNAIQFKAFIPLSTSGGNPLMIGTYYNYNRTDPFPSGKTELETDRMQKEFAKKRFFMELTKAPLKYSLWHIGKIRSLWALSYGIYDGWDLPPAKRVFVELYHRILVLLCLLGILFIVIQYNIPWLFLALFLFYHTLILVPFIGIPRYSFPMTPVACALAALGLWTLFPVIRETVQRLVGKKARLLIAMALAGILGSLFFSRAGDSEVWLARGLSPATSTAFSLLFKIVMFCFLLSPAILFSKKTDDKKERVSLVILGAFLSGFFLVTHTPALGFNLLEPYYSLRFREGYTALARPGDAVKKTFDLPSWFAKRDKIGIQIYMGFPQKAQNDEHLGLFIDNTLIYKITGEKSPSPAWYEFPVPREILKDKKRVTVSVVRLPSPRTPDSSLTPFLVGLKFRFPRGENSFNDNTEDLAPYIPGVQKGSFMIVLKPEKGDSSGACFFWGKKH